MDKDFAHLIATWPRHDKLTAIGSFAKDIGVGYDHANVMKQRNSIAPDFWPKVVKAAVKRGVALTHEQLVLMRGAAKRRKERRERPTARAGARVDEAKAA